MCESADAVQCAAVFEEAEFALLSTKGTTLSPVHAKKLLNN